MDPKILQSIFTVSTTKCWCTDSTNPVPDVVEGSPASRNYEGGFQVGLIRKDLGLGLEIGKEVGANLEFAKMSEDNFQDLEDAGHGKYDFGFMSNSDNLISFSVSLLALPLSVHS